jgi:hypothetical protein
MLINIWATLTHIGDESFCKNPSGGADIDLLVCEALERKTNGRQIWMINPFWRSGACTAEFLRESYGFLRDSGESYLVIYTPGFADILEGMSVEIAARAFHQLCRRARAFNKRVLVQQLGIPHGVSVEIAATIIAYNAALAKVVTDFDGDRIDLTSISYRPWRVDGNSQEMAQHSRSAKSSGPAEPVQAANIIAEAVINAHAQAGAWRFIHPEVS